MRGIFRLKVETPPDLPPVHEEGAPVHTESVALEFTHNEVHEDGCWCLGLTHRDDCKRWVLSH